MDDLNQKLQDLVEAEQVSSKAHALLLAARSGDGRMDFKGSAGEATPDARFPIASISKMFTANLILQLADDALIDLDQTVQSALPQVDLTDLHRVKGADYGPSLTIRQLLYQTSGLADYYEGGATEELLRNVDRRYDLDLVLRMARSASPMGRPDSGRAHYSDTNFQLLGAIIETVTNGTFDAALQARICAPLGLGRTRVFHPDDLPAPLALYNKAQRLDLPLALSSMGPDGGIVSDLSEMTTFLDAHLSGQLFSSAHLSEIFHWRPMFFPASYGGGLMRFKLPNWMTLWRGSPELIGHAGASAAFAFRVPERNISLVGTFNQFEDQKRPFRFMLKVLATIKAHERANG